MEAGRPLKVQELFYASIDGKHAALDDVEKYEFSFFPLCEFYDFNEDVLDNFVKGYTNASRTFGRQNRTSRTRYR